MPASSPLTLARRGLLLSLAVTAAAPASNFIWLPALGGSWNDKANWSGGTQVPGAADTTSLGNLSTTTPHTISVPTPVSVLALNFNRPSGTLDVPAGSSLTVTGTDAASTGTRLLGLRGGTLHIGGQLLVNSMLVQAGQISGTVDFSSAATGKLTLFDIPGGTGGGFRFNGSGEIVGGSNVSTTPIGVYLRNTAITGRAVTTGAPAQLKFPYGVANWSNVTLESAADVSDSVVSVVGPAPQPLYADFINYGTFNLNAGGSGTNTRLVDASIQNQPAGVITVAGGVAASFSRLVVNSGTINLNGPTTFQNVTNTAGGVMNVVASPTVSGTFTNSGTLNLTGPAALASAVTGSGALVQSVAGTSTLGGANTYTGATRVTHPQATLIATPAAYNNVLTNAGGLDVAAGAFVFQYDTGTTSVASPIDTVRTLLRAGFAGGLTSGQIRSAAASDLRGLGYADDGDRVTLRATFYGDADLDGGVSINDFNALATHFGQAGVWADGDFDYDGGVSINDFTLLAAAFGQSLNGPAAAVDYSGLLAFAAAHNDLIAFEAVTGVPEPVSGVALAAVMLVGSGRRGRRLSPRGAAVWR